MNTEIIELFNQIRPLLDQGHSYKSAINMINPNLIKNGQSKQIKEYGETQGYPSNNYNRRTQYIKRPHHNGKENKYGLYRVGLMKSPRYCTGHVWIYRYREKKQVKTICRSDLIALRKAVEAKELKWKVTDLEKAKNAYDLNKILQANARHNKNENTSGVFRVTKAICKRCKQGFIWQYANRSKNKNISLSALTLNELKNKVLMIGEEWIILDETKALENGLEVKV